MPASTVHARCGTHTFHRHLRDRHILRPTILNCCNLVFYRHRAPTASSANTIPSLFRTRSASTEPLKTTYCALRGHRQSSVLLLHLPRTPRRYCLALGALQHALDDYLGRVSSNFSSSPYTIRFQGQPTACLPYIRQTTHSPANLPVYLSWLFLWCMRNVRHRCLFEALCLSSHRCGTYRASSSVFCTTHVIGAYLRRCACLLSVRPLCATPLLF